MSVKNESFFFSDSRHRGRSSTDGIVGPSAVANPQQRLRQLLQMGARERARALERATTTGITGLTGITGTQPQPGDGPAAAAAVVKRVRMLPGSFCSDAERARKQARCAAGDGAGGRYRLLLGVTQGADPVIARVGGTFVLAVATSSARASLEGIRFRVLTRLCLYGAGDRNLSSTDPRVATLDKALAHSWGPEGFPLHKDWWRYVGSLFPDHVLSAVTDYVPVRAESPGEQLTWHAYDFDVAALHDWSASVRAQSEKDWHVVQDLLARTDEETARSQYEAVYGHV